MKLVELSSGKWLIRTGLWPNWRYLQCSDGHLWETRQAAERFASYESEADARAKLAEYQAMPDRLRVVRTVRI